MGTEESPEDGEDPEAEVDKETIHRLCPTYATDINSPLRHVRTRIYFTSESHVHSLINVLRFSHLAGRCYSPQAGAHRKGQMLSGQDTSFTPFCSSTGKPVLPKATQG